MWGWSPVQSPLRQGLLGAWLTGLHWGWGRCRLLGVPVKWEEGVALGTEASQTLQLGQAAPALSLAPGTGRGPSEATRSHAGEKGKPEAAWLVCWIAGGGSRAGPSLELPVSRHTCECPVSCWGDASLLATALVHPCFSLLPRPAEGSEPCLAAN